uniref:IST1 homolog isoform X1 n=1 Tax=Elaeis guineensis var. tenera TaxID=51953 RepID=A0A8N4F2R8_ELAGV|nr:IST1 homolog isoform X1 [Elaeis guineensis]
MIARFEKLTMPWGKPGCITCCIVSANNEPIRSCTMIHTMLVSDRKTCLNLAISRIKLLHNKRELQLKNMRREIFQYLQTGQEAIARIRVEHVIREQNILAAYEIIELFCEFVLARVPILETQRNCPSELQEAVASIIFASPRCSDLPELMQVRNLFAAKYGKEFVSAASELRPDSSVNRTIIEKLSVRAPPADLKLKVLKAIAQEYNLEWDSSNTEAEFSKKHEDLLDGSNPSNLRGPVGESSVDMLLPKNGLPGSAIKENQKDQMLQASIPSVNNPSALMSGISLEGTKRVEPLSGQKGGSPSDEKAGTSWTSSDVLERARAAIASAERASAAARAAAELVNVKLHRQASNTKS